MRIIILIIIGFLMTSCSKREIKRPVPKSIIVNNDIDKFSLTYKESLLLDVKIIPKEASQIIKYISGNNDIASIDDQGLITAKGIGKTNIVIVAENTITKKISIDVHIAGGINFSINGKEYILPQITNNPSKTQESLENMLQVVIHEHVSDDIEKLKVNRIKEIYRIPFSSFSYEYHMNENTLEELIFEYEINENLSLEEQKELGKTFLKHSKISLK